MRLAGLDAWEVNWSFVLVGVGSYGLDEIIERRAILATKCFGYGHDASIHVLVTLRMNLATGQR